jgi:hypothetical protein
MSKKNLIIILIVLLLLLTAIFLREKPSQVSIATKVPITTNKTEYGLEEFPIITIKNNLAGDICFSQCYRYYLEKENGEWESYLYEECKESDLIKRCIEPKAAIGLELLIDAPKSGWHRIALPACLNCQIGDYFKEEQKFYSNEFLIR